MAAAPTVLMISIVYVLLFSVSAQVEQRIAIGSNLTTSVNSKWSCLNGRYSFGLFGITSTLYVPGIWIDSIADRTLVWTLKGDSPVGEGSTLQLTATGLRLYHSRTESLLDLRGIAAVEMRNTSNLVFLNNLNEILWQSFDHPTDTLMADQTLEAGINLYSKVADFNYSRSRFVLRLLTNGDLMLLPMDTTYTSYWTSNTGTRDRSTLKFSDTSATIGQLYLEDKNTNNKKILCNDADRNGGRLYHRKLTLDTDGVLRGYVWTVSDTSWTSVWQAVDNPCAVSDQCGLNAICQVSTDNFPVCSSPPGFHFANEQEHYKGCVTNSVQQHNCSGSRLEELPYINWPGNENATVESLNASDCKQVCIEDCKCVVAIYDGTFCWKKESPGKDGHIEINSTAFVKVYDSLQSPFPGRQRKEGKGLPAVGISLLLCSSILAAVSLLFWFCRHRSKALKIMQQKQEHYSEGLKAFTYQEIDAATEGFKEEVGRGAFGKVYKGLLSGGREIAVKKLKKVVKEDEASSGDKEFITELNSIGACHHKNLVQLYGFFNKGCHRILMYEYMSNGSLGSALFEGNSYLDWKLRFQIALGTARGILYLHDKCRSPIIHCDIKPQNILLDEDFNAKISDFGIAKLMGREQTRTFTVARGTMGYIAPKWHRHIAITVKVDVYSFGVMLSENVFCRKILDLDVPENEIFLQDWAYDCICHGSLLKLVEQQGQQTIDVRQLERMVLVGLWCIQEDPFIRPSMKNVVQMLEGTVEIAVPPSPRSEGLPSTSIL